ncbi:hypothetical protein [Streptomyces yunnanensis]|uniref:DUF3311 domain-containing protein n=1 Tax=Streptomyces yunnanensis TaxID=156453 RepID=A0A9X8QQJ7_9ACTN|nr:hypothetical protein [Streptomyces yunnanensis]SHL36379.1 hypothetical protein SAMN05216268_10455 [Streptomyces yunnanensis]
MAAKDEPGRRRAGASRSGAWRALLLVPVAVALAIVLPFSWPRLLGIPLFYWLYFAVCLLTAVVSDVVQRLIKDL